MAPASLTDNKHTSKARARIAGEINTADLVIGVVLLLIIPIAVVALGNMFKGQDPVDIAARNNPTDLDAMVPDEELVRLRVESAERGYERNAKVILAKLQGLEDERQVSALRHMASATLQSALSEVKQLETDLAGHPQLGAPFHERIASLKSSLEAEINKVR